MAEKSISDRTRQARLLDNHRHLVAGRRILHTTPLPLRDPRKKIRRHMLDTGVAHRSGGKIRPPDDLRNLRCSVAEAEYDQLTQTTKARVVLEVVGNNPFRLNELMPKLDPRRWAELCGKEGWALSDEVDMRSGQPEPKPRKSVDPRKGWQGQFHEVFECNWSADLLTFTRFDLILNVTFRRGKIRENSKLVDAILFGYNLFSPISCKVFQVVEEGGIDIDSGELVVTETRAIATKNLRFTRVTIPGGSSLIPAFASSPLNVTAPALVSLALHEGLAIAFQDYIEDLPKKQRNRHGKA